MVWGPIQRCAPNSSEKPKSDHWYLRHRFREPESSTSAVRTSGWAPGQNSCPHFWVSGQHLSVDKGSAKGVVRVHKGMGVSVCDLLSLPGVELKNSTAFRLLLGIWEQTHSALGQIRF